MSDQHGMMIEKFLVPAAALVLLLVSVPALMQGHWVKGLFFCTAGAALIILMAVALWKGREQ
jgi:hypothetical protein